MQYGKIVGVHGSNISISVQASVETEGKTVDGNEQERHHFELTLPAASKQDVDYAVARMGCAVAFESYDAKITFTYDREWCQLRGIKSQPLDR